MAKIPERKILCETKNLTREEWLEYRRQGIGGSDAGAIVGLNPWSSPYIVWADKLGKLPPKEENEAMRVGRDLEDYVASRFCEATGKKVQKRNQMFQHPDHPWMLANIDRQVRGENAGLECKTTSALNMKNFKGQDFPDQYYAQCVHYMSVMNYDRMYLAVLIMGREFKIFTLERDPDEVNALIAAEEEFWNEYVLKEQAPPMDGSDKTSEAQGDIYKGGLEESTVLWDADDKIREYFHLKDSKSVIETQMEVIKQELQEELGDIEEGVTDNYKVTWKKQSRDTFDSKRFAKEHPDMDLSEYYKHSEYRVFKIKEVN